MELARATLHQLFHLQPTSTLALLRSVLNRCNGGDDEDDDTDELSMIDFQHEQFRNSRLMWFLLTEFRDLLQRFHRRFGSAVGNTGSADGVRGGGGEDSSFAKEFLELAKISNGSGGFDDNVLEFELLVDLVEREWLQKLLLHWEKEGKMMDKRRMKEHLQDVKLAYQEAYCSSSSRDRRNSSGSDRHLHVVLSSVQASHTHKRRSAPTAPLDQEAISLLTQLCFICPDLGIEIIERLGGTGIQWDQNTLLREHMQAVYLNIIHTNLQRGQIVDACYFLRFLDINQDAKHMVASLREIFSKIVSMYMAETPSLEDGTSEASEAEVNIQHLVFESLLCKLNEGGAFMLREFNRIEEDMIGKTEYLDQLLREQPHQQPITETANSTDDVEEKLWWRRILRHARKTDQHILELIVTNCLDLLSKGDYETAATLLSRGRLQSLRPLIVLLHWDTCANNVDALEKLVKSLWGEHSRKTSTIQVCIAICLDSISKT